MVVTMVMMKKAMEMILIMKTTPALIMEIMTM